MDRWAAAAQGPRLIQVGAVFRLHVVGYNLIFITNLLRSQRHQLVMA